VSDGILNFRAPPTAAGLDACPDRYLLTEPGMGYRYQPGPEYAPVPVLEGGDDLGALAAGQRADHR